MDAKDLCGRIEGMLDRAAGDSFNLTLPQGRPEIVKLWVGWITPASEDILKTEVKGILDQNPELVMAIPLYLHRDADLYLINLFPQTLNLGMRSPIIGTFVDFLDKSSLGDYVAQQIRNGWD